VKIALAHNFYRIRGGEDAVVERELGLLTGRGHSLSAFFRNSGSELGGANLQQKLKVAITLSHREDIFRDFTSFLSRERPDVVHVHNTFPLLTPAVLRAAKSLGIPAVMTLHNFRLICANGLFLRNNRPCEKCLHGSPFWGTAHACYQGSRAATLPLSMMIRKYSKGADLNRLVDRFIALSPFSAAKFVEAGILPEKLTIKPNFCEDPGPPPPWKERAGFALFVGRLSEEKGLKQLLTAWKEIAMPLKIAGTGPLLDWARANLPPQAQLIGNVDARGVRALMRQASMLVIPSICYENFPMVLAEAWANGLPVAASKLGSLEALIRDGHDGLLFDPHNPTGMRHALTAAMGNQGLMAALSQNGRTEYEKNLTPLSAALALERIYSEAAAASRA
jgi:glycosyltransferase involved in cell wall biosynthesis